jgi:hypothetical protein
MTRSIIALATAVLAATTLLSPAAEAGFKVHFGFGGGPAPYLTDYNKESAHGYKPARKRYQAARRHEAAPVRAAKKPSKTESVAEVEDKVEEKTESTPAKIAETENSSISVAQAEVAQEPSSEPVETVAATDQPNTVARSIDCKKFFPTVGLTLSVPCERAPGRDRAGRESDPPRKCSRPPRPRSQDRGRAFLRAGLRRRPPGAARPKNIASLSRPKQRPDSAPGMLSPR